MNVSLLCLCTASTREHCSSFLLGDPKNKLYGLVDRLVEEAVQFMHQKLRPMPPQEDRPAREPFTLTMEYVKLMNEEVIDMLSGGVSSRGLFVSSL